MHISSDGSKSVIESLDKLDLPSCPDLLVITGDVVNGRFDAINLTKNYEAAQEVIEKIAWKLWSKEARLRADWRKRIVITIGNHDYASMNELAATNEKRATVMARPTTGKSGPAIKYPYFIDFVRRLLHIDTDEWVDDGLNEVREYTKLNLNIIGINTISDVNPLRTNKVSIDTDKVLRLLAEHRDQLSKEDMANVILMHHTPLYKIDYLADAYLDLRSKLNAKKDLKLIDLIDNATAPGAERKAVDDLRNFVDGFVSPTDGSAAKDILSEITRFLDACNDSANSALNDIAQGLKEYIVNHKDKYMNEQRKHNYVKLIELIKSAAAPGAGKAVDDLREFVEGIVPPSDSAAKDIFSKISELIKNAAAPDAGKAVDDLRKFVEGFAPPSDGAAKDIFSEISRFLDACNGSTNIAVNDIAQGFIGYVASCNTMSTADQADYEEAVRTISGKISGTHPLSVILGGHQHQFGFGSFSFKTDEHDTNKRVATCEAGRFYEKISPEKPNPYRNKFVEYQCESDCPFNYGVVIVKK